MLLGAASWEEQWLGAVCRKKSSARGSAMSGAGGKRDREDRDQEAVKHEVRAQSVGGRVGANRVLM